MASVQKRLPTNVPGEFYVDSTCIDCDTCRWMARDTFNESGDQSRVYQQPQSDEQRLAALQALIACPTGSIGTTGKVALKSVENSFPIPIDENVFHCGYHAESSFGAASYFIQRPKERGGNVLIDSPRFTAPLLRRLESLGGVSTLFLTHSDDLADQQKFVDHFGCRRAMHASEAEPDFEIPFDGEFPFQLDEEITLIPTPGHTRGSSCLLYRGKFLFTGDHAAFSETREHVYAFRGACWYDWKEQIRSMERLAQFDFEWILPGHGRRCHFSKPQMREQMRKCIDWMKGP